MATESMTHYDGGESSAVARPMNKRPARRRMAISIAATLTVVVSGVVATSSPSSAAAPTAEFATFTDADGGTVDGVNFSMAYDFDGVPPRSPEVSTAPLNGSDYNPPGTATQPALDLPMMKGAVTITFDSPVTNLSLYAL